ncbi:MAG: ABC transporter permease [Bacilli bacterium]|nr:ABC transporter permease [Bacilli bacterium]
MIIFKTFLKVLNKCKFPLILYTTILVFVCGFNMQTSENSLSFVESRPDILIINQDEEKGITKNLVEYIKENSKIKKIKDNEQARDDALFYRDVNYIIYIPKGYREDFLNGMNPEIKIKSTNDYQASYADMILKRYLKVANTYQSMEKNENRLIEKVNKTLSKKTKVELTTKKDTDSIEKMSFYYKFLNYSILAGSIYVICLILSSFHEEKIKKRITISSISYKKHNQVLLLSNLLLSLVVWMIYVVLSIVLCGKIVFTSYGLICIMNSLIFTLCSLTIAFLISTLVNNKNAINGIINVVALGSSFLCGAFVPLEFLPKSVLKFAHILPSYWYINTNEMIKDMEVMNINTIQGILLNMGILIIFSIIFIILANMVTKKKLKSN